MRACIVNCRCRLHKTLINSRTIEDPTDRNFLRWVTLKYIKWAKKRPRTRMRRSHHQAQAAVNLRSCERPCGGRPPREHTTHGIDAEICFAGQSSTSVKLRSMTQTVNYSGKIKSKNRPNGKCETISAIDAYVCRRISINAAVHPRVSQIIII